LQDIKIFGLEVLEEIIKALGLSRSPGLFLFIN
jgi:hypothetical protein